MFPIARKAVYPTTEVDAMCREFPIVCDKGAIIVRLLMMRNTDPQSMSKVGSAFAREVYCSGREDGFFFTGAYPDIVLTTESTRPIDQANATSISTAVWVIDEQYILHVLIE